MKLKPEDRSALQGAARVLTEILRQSPPEVPEDVERATGDYGGHRRELTRSGLSESGWFQRAKGGSFRGWMELSADRAKHVTNIREDQ